MKKFVIWQLSTTLVVVVVYLLYLARGFGGSNAVCYAMVGAMLATIVNVHLLRIELLPTMKIGLEFVLMYTTATSLVLGAIALWAAKICGLATLGMLVTFCFVFLLAMMIVAEAAMVMIVFIITFAVGFGSPISVSLFLFGVALALAHSFYAVNSKLRYECMVLSGALQALLTYHFFIQTAKFFDLRFLH